MNKKYLGLFCLLILWGPWASADELAINLNAEAVRVFYTKNATDRLQVEAGFLYNEDEVKIPNIGVHLVDQSGSKSRFLHVGLGAQLYGVKAGPLDVLAIGLGGALIFIPEQLYGRLRFRLEGHYAPSVVTYQDADSFWEVRTGLEYELLKSGFVYVGYRAVRAELDPNGTAELDDGVHAGIRLQF